MFISHISVFIIHRIIYVIVFKKLTLTSFAIRIFMSETPMMSLM